MKTLKKRFKLFDASRLATRNTRLSRFLNKVINNCQVDRSAVIDKSLKLSHDGALVVIGRNAKIGKNVQIYHNVTVGTAEIYTDEYPTIEDNVIIYPGSIIIGKITIGKGSVIGAQSFINKDVPPESVVHTERKMIVRRR